MRVRFPSAASWKIILQAVASRGDAMALQNVKDISLRAGESALFFCVCALPDFKEIPRHFEKPSAIVCNRSVCRIVFLRR